jgi:hypothetical protein
MEKVESSLSAFFLFFCTPFYEKEQRTDIIYEAPPRQSW